jgi:hypothetical protein
MSTDCPKEVCQQSPCHCFGTIKDDEAIVFVLVDPDHYRNGELQKGVFSHKKLRIGIFRFVARGIPRAARCKARS